ncbi:MAG: DNA mismatch repair protein MutS [Pyrinomonadaceae bacterium]
MNPAHTSALAATPLRKQYLEIKQRYADAILLFRIGDFYEAFDDDARLLARELDIVLTSKSMGRIGRVPLAGVPHHSLERHLATLIARGHRIAICEQLTNAPVRGNAAAGRGLIERGVVRVVTPGTILEPGLLQSKANNFLAAFVTVGKRAGIAYADVTTGYFAATELDAIAAEAELQRISPAELLLPHGLEVDCAATMFVTRRDAVDFEADTARRLLLKHFGARTLAPYGLSEWPLAACAAGAVIAYLRDTQTSAAEQLTRLTSYRTDDYMMLDARTLRSLEVFESGSGAPTLLSIIDATRTSMGGRFLRRLLRQPLLNVAEIFRRQEYVAWFIAHKQERVELCAALENVHDLERLSGRTRSGFASAQDLFTLGRSLEAIKRVRSVLQKDAKHFNATLTALPTCDAAANLIRKALPDDFPTRSERLGIIREGYSDELDKLRAILRDGQTFLAEMEGRERARTGIKSLRVGYNKVFGYFIEVTRPNLHLVPDDYTRKQTLANAERFITLELKEYEALVTNAVERIGELESSLFRQLCVEVSRSRPEILIAAATLAHLDVMASFAETAAQFNYVRPSIIDARTLNITAGRHPVLERIFGNETFVANDVQLGGESGEPDIALITGPNMSGKSTYLRQTALIVLMAQIGCFVPASAAAIGLCDRIFTRAGLYDRLGSGESTFMTEMVETAEILHHATPRSLILLDELGRGTSTYDGLSVARAVLEYLHNHPQLRSKTLFATHYHELTELEELLPRLKNFRVEIAEEGRELRFLFKISPGIAEKSYGVYAAKLAGLPRPVVRRAEKLLADYEAQRFAPDYRRINRNETEQTAPPPPDESFASEAEARAQVAQALLEIDLDSLSPVEALMRLYELRRLAEAGKGGSLKIIKRA